MKPQKRFRLVRILIILCLLGIVGASLFTVIGSVYTQLRLVRAVDEFMVAQEQLVAVHLGRIEQQNRSVVNARDQLIGGMLSQMSSDQRPVWESAVEQLPEIVVEPISLPEFESDMQLSCVYVLAAIVCAVLGLLGILVLFRANLDEEMSAKTPPPPEEPAVPKGFQEIFSQPVDPIGNLHAWRVRTESEITENGTTLDDLAEQLVAKELEGDRAGLIRALLLVRDLEEFLKVHCNIGMIQEVGTQVPFNPSFHNPEEEVMIRPGRIVQVTSSGWKWNDYPLRYPEVR